MLVVMMLMTASSAMAQEAKFEVISGLRYLLDTGAIVVLEKVKSSDGMSFVVTSLSEQCFSDCSGLTSITISSSVTSLGVACFSRCSGLETVYFKGKYCNSSYTDFKYTNDKYY